MNGKLNIPEEPYVWHRTFARLFDVYVIGGLLFVVLFSLLAAKHTHLYFQISAFFDDKEPLIFIPPFVLFSFIEPFLISRFQTTPGKALFGLRVHYEDEENLSLKDSFRRTFYAMGFGVAFGLPLVQYVTGLRQFVTVKKNHKTFYDKQLQTVITYVAPGFFRRLLSLLAVTLVFILHIFGSGYFYNHAERFSYESPQKDFVVQVLSEAEARESNLSMGTEHVKVTDFFFVWRAYNYDQVTRWDLSKNVREVEFIQFTDEWFEKEKENGFVLVKSQIGKSDKGHLIREYSLESKKLGLSTTGAVIQASGNQIYFVQSVHLVDAPEDRTFLESFQLKSLAK